MSADRAKPAQQQTNCKQPSYTVVLLSIGNIGKTAAIFCKPQIIAGKGRRDSFDGFLQLNIKLFNAHLSHQLVFVFKSAECRHLLLPHSSAMASPLRCNGCQYTVTRKLSLPTTSHISLRSSTSTPAVGSSRKRILGWWLSALAIKLVVSSHQIILLLECCAYPIKIAGVKSARQMPRPTDSQIDRVRTSLY